MRIEPVSGVYRFGDRRSRSDGPGARSGSSDAGRREHAGQARLETPHVWMHAPFGAHILGQIAPERATRATIARAYTQPESRTPLKPRNDVRA